MLLVTFKRVTRWECLKTNEYLKMMMTRFKTHICVFYRNLVEAHKILLLRIIPRQRNRLLARTPAMVMRIKLVMRNRMTTTTTMMMSLKTGSVCILQKLSRRSQNPT